MGNQKSDKKEPKSDNLTRQNNKALQIEIFPTITPEEYSQKESKRKERLAEIVNLWPKMETKKDLLQVLNIALKVLYDKKAKPISMCSLNYYAYSKICKKRYVSFQIPQKKKAQGGFPVDAPT